MARVVRTALVYFVAVFAAAFALGVVRVLWVAPWLGGRWAELLEMPVVLAVAFAAARRVLGRMRPAPGTGERAAVGALALVLLVAAELTVVLGLRGLSLAQALAERDPVSGAAYLIALVLFAAMPVLAGIADGRTPEAATESGGSASGSDVDERRLRR